MYVYTPALDATASIVFMTRQLACLCIWRVQLNKSRQLRSRGFWSEHIWYNSLRNVLRTIDLSRQICAYKNEHFFCPLPPTAILRNTQGCQETQSVPLPICTVTATVTVMYTIVAGLVWMLFESHSKEIVTKYLNSMLLIYVLSIYRSFRDFILQYWQERQSYRNIKMDNSACLS